MIGSWKLNMIFDMIHRLLLIFCWIALILGLEEKSLSNTCKNIDKINGNLIEIEPDAQISILATLGIRGTIWRKNSGEMSWFSDILIKTLNLFWQSSLESFFHNSRWRPGTKLWSRDFNWAAILWTLSIHPKLPQQKRRWTFSPIVQQYFYSRCEIWWENTFLKSFLLKNKKHCS